MARHDFPDLHTKAAADALDISPHLVTKDQRAWAKSKAYLTAYGAPERPRDRAELAELKRAARAVPYRGTGRPRAS